MIKPIEVERMEFAEGSFIGCGESPGEGEDAGAGLRRVARWAGRHGRGVGQHRSQDRNGNGVGHARYCDWFLDSSATTFLATSSASSPPTTISRFVPE